MNQIDYSISNSPVIKHYLNEYLGISFLFQCPKNFKGSGHSHMLFLVLNLCFDGCCSSFYLIGRIHLRNKNCGNSHEKDINQIISQFLFIFFLLIEDVL